MKKIIISAITATALFTLAGCSSSSDSQANGLDSEIRSAINSFGLTGDPSEGITIPSIDANKTQLGMKLFFSKALGGDKDSACVTCHHPVLGGGDNLSLPIGTESLDPDLLGFGRLSDPDASHFTNGEALVPRNAPSTYNAALWKRLMFWDGRVENIQVEGVSGIRTPDTALDVIDVNAGTSLAVAQARFPVTSKEEMRGHTFEAGNTNDEARNHLTLRLADETSVDYIPNTWQDEFTPVYGPDSLTFANITDALGEYENSQLFIESPWKSYVEGNTEALSESAKRGAKLFFSSYSDGGMSCVSCHSGDFFTDENFHVMAIPQVGHGKNPNNDDLGRFNETGTQKYAFRTPTLLNVEMTGPWGHDGAYTTLASMVRHMVNPDTAIAEYDVLQLDQNVLTTNVTENTNNALDQLKANKVFGISPHQNVDASEENINDLVTFLESLTDPCLKDRECIGKWIADSTVIDSLELNAKDADGNLL